MWPTLLVVDDEEPVRALLVDVFEDLGYRVLQANNGRQALVVLDQETVGLVLSDVMMPVLDGYALCRQLKARADGHVLPVILMSATAHLDSSTAGADATIRKPFSIEAVEALVRQWLPPPAG